MLTNAHVLSWHKQNKTFFHSMITSNIACLNEEPGEVTFSMLGRMTLGDNLRCKFSHMKKYYQLLPFYRSLNEKIMEEVPVPLCPRSGHITIKPDCEEIKMVTHFLLSNINQAKRNIVSVYNGTKKAYKNVRAAANGQVPYTPSLVWQADMTDQLTRLWTNSQDNTLDWYFLQDHIDEWGESARPRINPGVIVRRVPRVPVDQDGDVEVDEELFGPVPPVTPPPAPEDFANPGGGVGVCVDSESVDWSVGVVSRQGNQVDIPDHGDPPSDGDEDDDDNISRVSSHVSSSMSHAGRRFERQALALRGPMKRKAPDRLLL
jgi:hypothetical protein